MKYSTERILTTHTGSLPRPAELQELLYVQERDEPFDQAIFEEKVRSAVQAMVRQQVAVGIDVINDGEMSKISYATYVKHLYWLLRLSVPKQSSKWQSEQQYRSLLDVSLEQKRT